MWRLPHTSCRIIGAQDVADFLLDDRRAHVLGNASLANLMLSKENASSHGRTCFSIYMSEEPAVSAIKIPLSP